MEKIHMKTVRHRGCLPRVNHWLKHADQFGHPISLTFHHHPEFRSVAGGFISLNVTGLMISYFFYLLFLTINGQAYSVVASMTRNDINSSE